MSTTTIDKKQNLQDTFLNSVRRAKTPLTIFLVNGVKLQGVVSWLTTSACCCGAMGNPSSSTSTPSQPSCPRSRSSYTSRRQTKTIEIQ